jgi:hypothetical protein
MSDDSTISQPMAPQESSEGDTQRPKRAIRGFGYVYQRGSV